MKRFLILTFMGSLLLVGRSFANEKDAGEFPLTVHITAVEMKQGVRGVSGSGSTDSNGNYSSSVSGGGSYTWHLYTAQIDGNNKTYGLILAQCTIRGARDSQWPRWAGVRLLPVAEMLSYILADIVDDGTRMER